jgi:SAM-dependent methyltransferase
VGCGKGRALLFAAKSGYSTARGVEYASELCAASQRNCAAYRSRTGSSTRFEIVQADAAVYPFAGDESVVFLYNPFNEIILRPMLANLAASLRARPRGLLLAYYRPVWRAVIDRHPDFRILDEFPVGDARAVIYAGPYGPPLPG